MSRIINQRGFGVVEVVVVAVILALIVIGGWYVWQAQDVPATQAQLNDKATPHKMTETFSDSYIPFIFEYPKGWTVKIDKRPQADQPLPDQYIVEIQAPGTTLTEQPIGGLFITKGARVVVHDSKTTLTNIQDRFTGFYGTAVTGRMNVTVADIPAVEYFIAYESDPAVLTEFLKDGRIYTLEFSAEGEERTSAYFSDYETLLASFKFK